MRKWPSFMMAAYSQAPQRPALEGQQITCGMLAVPGVISNLDPEPPHHRVIVLDSEMKTSSH